jgi:NAD-dependent dihydropyrimidine dehydrogenase PreA subunit
MRTLTAEAAAAALARAELEPNLPAGKSAEATPGPASFPDQEPQLAPRLVLYEGPGTQPLAAEERCAIMAGLLEKGWAVTRTSDPTEVGHALPPFRLMLGQFNGAEVSPLLDEADRPPRHDLSGLKAAQVPGLVADWHARNQIPQPGAWLPWFPVIDFDRCTHCMQCLSFCLFEVFGVDEHHRIRTQHPANCKTHCPACSRLCPEAAIIFPKYQGGPISGEDFGEGLPGRDAMKIDISALLGGDVYSLLRDRNARSRVRFSKDRDAQQALAERRRCLAQAARMADIPPEVLMALPTPAEIQRRTEEAKAKAQEALHRKEKPA